MIGEQGGPFLGAYAYDLYLLGFQLTNAFIGIGPGRINVTAQEVGQDLSAAVIGNIVELLLGGFIESDIPELIRSPDSRARQGY